MAQLKQNSYVVVAYKRIEGGSDYQFSIISPRLTEFSNTAAFCVHENKPIPRVTVSDIASHVYMYKSRTQAHILSTHLSKSSFHTRDGHDFTVWESDYAAHVLKIQEEKENKKEETQDYRLRPKVAVVNKFDNSIIACFIDKKGADHYSKLVVDRYNLEPRNFKIIDFDLSSKVRKLPVDDSRKKEDIKRLSSKVKEQAEKIEVLSSGVRLKDKQLEQQAKLLEDQSKQLCELERQSSAVLAVRDQEIKELKKDKTHIYMLSEERRKTIQEQIRINSALSLELKEVKEKLSNAKLQLICTGQGHRNMST